MTTTHTTKLHIGDLIRNSHGTEGIVFSAERKPNKQWLAAQEDTRIAKATGPWWKVLPLTGGAVIVADDIGTHLRRANIDDLHMLVKAQQSEHAGHATLKELLANL